MKLTINIVGKTLEDIEQALVLQKNKRQIGNLIWRKMTNNQVIFIKYN